MTVHLWWKCPRVGVQLSETTIQGLWRVQLRSAVTRPTMNGHYSYKPLPSPFWRPRLRLHIHPVSFPPSPKLRWCHDLSQFSSTHGFGLIPILFIYLLFHQELGFQMLCHMMGLSQWYENWNNFRVLSFHSLFQEQNYDCEY